MTTIRQLLVLCLLLLAASNAYKICSQDRGGGICPDYNTCCATGTPGVSSCIARTFHDEEEGDCCMDTGLGVTGCKAGYECISKGNGKLGGHSNATISSGTIRTTLEYNCHRIDPNYDGPVPKPLLIPRYQIRPMPSKTMTQAYGIALSERSKHEDNNNTTKVHVAYFSTMGALDSSDPHDLKNHHRVSTVFIIVHGSGRTAAEYNYGAATCLQPDQQDPTNSTMMVLSPWFLDPQDNLAVDEGQAIPVPLPPHTLRWVDKLTTKTEPHHTWRFGANAINSTISSFDAVDAMVEQLVHNQIRFPHLKRIVLSGHSAGGQFVQRWALVSNTLLAWNQAVDRGIQIRTVPANPRCFCFLDNRRFVVDPTTNQTVFKRPSKEAIAKCPVYDQWFWGLEAGGNAPSPYKDRAIAEAGGAQQLAKRYVTSRRVVYLAGGEDLQVFGDYCGSEMQGSTRRERSHAFLESLLHVFPDEMKRYQQHNRVEVPGIPHDHILMYQSPEGQMALFGDDDNEEDHEIGY